MTLNTKSPKTDQINAFIWKHTLYLTLKRGFLYNESWGPQAALLAINNLEYKLFGS